MSGFPIHPEALSPDCFTSMLREAGAIASGNAVNSFDVGYIGDVIELLGMVTRVRLDYTETKTRRHRRRS